MSDLSPIRQWPKTPPDATSEMMEDEYDASSLIYCAKYGPDVIATMRANISKSDGQKFPFEKYFGSCESLGISRHNSCEISRLAILPEFQGSDLFIGFVKVTSADVSKAGPGYYVLCCYQQALTHVPAYWCRKDIQSPVRHPVLTDESLSLYQNKNFFCFSQDQIWNLRFGKNF